MEASRVAWKIPSQMKRLAKMYPAAGTITSVSPISSYLTFMAFFVCSLSRYTDNRRYRFESWEQSARTSAHTRVRRYSPILFLSRGVNSLPRFAPIMCTLIRRLLSGCRYLSTMTTIMDAELVSQKPTNKRNVRRYMHRSMLLCPSRKS